MSTPTTSPFLTSSDAEGSGRNVSAYEGALCIFTYKEQRTVLTKQYGEKPAVLVDVDCVQGVPAGTLSKMPNPSFGQPPEKLEDLTGDVETDVLIFQGFLRNSFRGRKAGEMVLGRIAVEGKIVKASANDQDFKASYVLLDPSAEDIAKATAYLQAKTAKQLSAPSSTQQPAAAPAASNTAGLTGDPERPPY